MRQVALIGNLSYNISMKINSDYTKTHLYNEISKLARRVIGTDKDERITVQTPELGDYAKVLQFCADNELSVSHVNRETTNYSVKINIGYRL